ncbi:MAG TPA: trigger factor [Lachnospiraceae bacterium]|nr:trigger factor [Lachnospiraceae bacterium]
MSVQVEKLEGSMAKLTIEVSADEMEKAVNAVYLRQKKSISIPGFRKGKVPRMMVEKMYGPSVFYEDAANDLINKTYPDAADEADVEIVSRPSIEVVQMEKGKEFIYTAEVALKPAVVLGEYKGMEVPAQPVEVTDEEVENSLKREQEKNARTVTVEGRAAEMGDTVVLDYAGTVDGVAFDGGTAADADLELGSGSFIPGFEDQLVGVNAGEERDVAVTFPESYHAEDLAGKAAIFHCTVKEIKAKELPELNDEFAADVSEFETLEEYKADIRKNLEETKKSQAEQFKRDEAVAKAAGNSTIEIPQAMIDTQAEQMIDNFTNQLRQQGMSLEDYERYTGMDAAKLQNVMKPQAEEQIRTRLTLEAIAEAENIDITEEQIDEELANMAATYGMEVDKIKEIMGDAEKQQIKDDLAVRAAAALVAENAVEVEKAEEEEAEAADESEA